MRSKPVMLPVMRSLCRVRKRSMTVLRMRFAKNIMPETVMERLYFGCGQRPRCDLCVSVSPCIFICVSGLLLVVRRPASLSSAGGIGAANDEKRWEEHTSELQSRGPIVFRLLL